MDMLLLPPATDMDMLLLTTDMLLPELPIVDMLLLAMNTEMLLPELSIVDMLLVS